ncbi:MAG: exodeoxyribonuclease III [Deltaproteobacteria bacterium]|nr:exodeoxyribonuclease III [Deltaproteobacteria bacterium]
MAQEIKLASWNVNGLRAIAKKGELNNFLQQHDPDIILYQETKAGAHQLSPELTENPLYHQFYHAAVKPGYAGTAIWAKKAICPECTFLTGMPGYEDDEGRIAQLKLPGLHILGVYFPNGGKSEAAWRGKLTFYEIFLDYINDLRRQGEKVIFAGDVNCCHEEIDIARPKENDGEIGFHPEERRRISAWVAAGWVDVWRRTFPDKGGVYSWWSFRAGARQRNVGWRIDYFFVDQSLFSNVTAIDYLSEQTGSDHCPVIMKTRIE